MSIDTQKIQALAKAAIEQSDNIGEAAWYTADCLQHLLHAGAPDAEFIAAANPAAVLELIAEIQRLKAVEDYLELELSGVERAKNDLAEKLGCADEPRWKWLLSGADDLIRQRDQLKAENEALQAAERTLTKLGYRHCGGELWKPPLGPRPSFLDQEPVMACTSCLVCGKFTDHDGLPCPKMSAYCRASRDALDSPPLPPTPEALK